MLHVPHPLDGERGPGDETAQDQLAALLGRALNSFDLPDELVERLDPGDGAHHFAALLAAHVGGGPGRPPPEPRDLPALLSAPGRHHRHPVGSDPSRRPRVRPRGVRGRGGGPHRRGPPAPQGAPGGRGGHGCRRTRARKASWRPLLDPPPLLDPLLDSPLAAPGPQLQDLRDLRGFAELQGFDASWESGLGPDALAEPPRTRRARNARSRTPPTTPPTTHVGCCAAPRTATGPATTPRCGCGRRARTGSPRRSAATAARAAAMPPSRCTSTRSCCSTAAS